MHAYGVLPDTVPGSKAGVFGTWWPQVIDFNMGAGAVLLGHAYPTVVRAVQDQAAQGTGSLLTIRWNWKLPNSWQNSYLAPKWFGSARGEGKPTPWQSVLPEPQPGATRSCLRLPRLA